jgi:hypothetical protein
LPHHWARDCRSPQGHSGIVKRNLRVHENFTPPAAEPGHGLTEQLHILKASRAQGHPMQGFNSSTNVDDDVQQRVVKLNGWFSG